jgi:hypothetical protein
VDKQAILARGIKLGNGAGHTYTIWRELQNITNLEDDWVALDAIQYKYMQYTMYSTNEPL